MRIAIVVADTREDIASSRSATLTRAGYHVRTALSSDTLLNSLRVAPADLTLATTQILRTNVCHALTSPVTRSRFGVFSVLMEPSSVTDTLNALELCDATAPYELAPSELLRLATLLLKRNRPHTTIQENLAQYCAKHRLSPRERSVLEHAALGASNDEIAATLGCARPTISTYWNRIFDKTGKRTYRELIAHFLYQCDAARGDAPRTAHTPTPAESGLFPTNHQRPKETSTHQASGLR